MGRRGPRPEPTALKVLKGNPGKRALNKREAKPEAKIPTAPSHLDAYAKREWRRVTRLLDEIKLLANVDRAALASYCAAVSEQRSAALKMQTEGRYIETPKGGIIRAPWVIQWERATALVRQLAAEFGMTPSSRSRVKTETAPEPEAEDAELAAARERRNASRAS